MCLITQIFRRQTLSILNIIFVSADILTNAGHTMSYAVKTESIHIHLGDSLIIESLLDKQQFYDPEGLAEARGISSASWPLFGLVWPSAQRLANLMQSWDIKNLRILEIGCGLALASLVIHRRGGNIIASDHHPLTESFLKKNIEHNHLSKLRYSGEGWAAADTLGTFDLIIGSDVLYERDIPSILGKFIERHSQANTEVIIIDPNRGNRSTFTKLMNQLEFHLEETLLKPEISDLNPYNGRQLHYKRNAQK
jgi:predicted nicotinamide N-methyase